MKRLFLLLAFSHIVISVSGQDAVYRTGLIEDDEAYSKIPLKATLATRDYTVLPPSYSLLQFCPKVGSQGDHGTCTAWSTTYAARTIAEAVKWGWKDKDTITREAFAPLSTYAQIKNGSDKNCDRGVNMSSALNLLKNNGAPKLRSFNVACAEFVPNVVKEEAKKYLIDDYSRLFGGFEKVAENDKIYKVKKSLSQDCPVLICMNLLESFTRAIDVWEPSGKLYGYHAMCVIGYDDNKAGGAFQIMNSWGEYWGNKGFIWVKYSDFTKYVDFAFEMYVKKTRYQENIDEEKEPKPTPIVNTMNELKGSMYLKLTTGEIITQKLKTSDELPIYQAKGKYLSGTKFRLYISNNAPAYVYVIASDLDNNVTKLFPTGNVNASLNYSYNNIVLPDEEDPRNIYYFDNNARKDYFCVIYAAKELPIDDIIRRVMTTPGSFPKKLKSSLSDNGLVKSSDIIYQKSEISFETLTKGNVVPLILELSHQ